MGSPSGPLSPGFFSFTPTPIQMALDTNTPIADLGAVNRLLAAVGEAPLASLGSGRPDETWALQILDENHRRLLTERNWRCNASIGYEVAPIDTYDWVDSAGRTTTLNIFQVPDNVLSWDLSRVLNQTDAAASQRETERYTDGGSPVSAIVDILRNRDGWPVDSHPYLYLDLQYYRAWDDLPETLRALVILRSMQDFILQMEKGQGSTPNWLARKLQEAEKEARRTQALPAGNRFDNPEHAAIRGLRRPRTSIPNTHRSYRR